MLKTYIPAFLWACIILVFCGYPGSGLPHVSFHFILPLDKSIHIFLFGMLCFLLQRVFKKGNPGTWLHRFPVFSAFAISTVYGILIEYMQRYVFIGRSFEGMDIIADASGAFLIILYYWFKSQRLFFFESNLTDLVFEEKNKRYGAYLLRKRYSRQVVKAFLLAVLLVVLIFGLPFLAGLFEVQAVLEEVVEVNTVQLLVPPEFDQPAVATEVAVPVKEVSKPKIVKDLPNASPASLKEPVSNPNVHLTDLFEKAKRDTLAAPVDSSVAEVQDKPPIEKEKLKIAVDVVPAFPGGPEAFFAFLKKNMIYPAMAQKSGIAGTVVISFVVEDNGKGDKYKILRGLPGGCNEEAIRVLSLMPAWVPGKRRGISIPFMMVLPVEFALR